MGNKLALIVAEDDVELVRSALAEAAETRARAAEAAAVLLEEERRANPRKDLRTHHGRVGRILAAAGVLRALSAAPLTELGDAPPATPANRTAPPDSVALPSGNVAASGEAAPGTDPVDDPEEADPPPAPVPASVAPADGDADGEGDDDVVAGEQGATSPAPARSPDYVLDGEGAVVAMTDRQRRRQALSAALTARRQAYEPGKVYALDPATVEVIAAIEGYNVDPRADDGREAAAAVLAGQPDPDPAELADAVTS